jgi:hypothetical protein
MCLPSPTRSDLHLQYSQFTITVVSSFQWMYVAALQSSLIWLAVVVSSSSCDCVHRNNRTKLQQLPSVCAERRQFILSRQLQRSMRVPSPIHHNRMMMMKVCAEHSVYCSSRESLVTVTKNENSPRIAQLLLVHADFREPILRLTVKSQVIAGLSTAITVTIALLY